MGIGKKIEVIAVGYRELEELIRTTYGHDYSISGEEDWDGGRHGFRVEKAELVDYARGLIETFKSTGLGFFLLDVLLADMANNDVIEAGDYLIEVPARTY